VEMRYSPLHSFIPFHDILKIYIDTQMLQNSKRLSITLSTIWTWGGYR